MLAMVRHLLRARRKEGRCQGHVNRGTSPLCRTSSSGYKVKEFDFVTSYPSVVFLFGVLVANVLDAAKRALEEAGKPLPVREITKTILERGYWQTQGLTPEATVQARLATDIKNLGEASAFVRVAPGVYGLGALKSTTTEKEEAVEQRLFENEEAEPDDDAASLSFAQAAAEVLQELKPPRPLHYRNITKLALESGRLRTKGKTPEATMYVQILSDIERCRKYGLPQRFVKEGPGIFALASPDGIEPAYPVWRDQDEAFLQRVKLIHPAQFETLVSTLLTRIYEGAVIIPTPYSGDGGIDAIGMVTLKGGISVELVAQAKRNDKSGNVNRPQIQAFRGSMRNQSIGVFITTTGFSSGAIKEAQRKDAANPIGLINGRKLVRLLQDYQVGITDAGDPDVQEK